MGVIEIDKNKVKLVLSQPMSKIRIADKDGNHIRKPTKEARNTEDSFVEWMITNDEIKELIQYHLNNSDKNTLKSKISGINTYLKGSEFAVREASKQKIEKTFMGFEIFEYKEKFYSFEKKFESGIKIRLTFKMGDYTLAVHMFVLLPFHKNIIQILNKYGKVRPGEILGSGCYTIWKPNKLEIMSIIEALSNASENHKNDLLKILSVV